MFPFFLKMGELFAHFEKKNGKNSGNFPEIFSRFIPVYMRKPFISRTGKQILWISVSQ